MVVQLKFKPTFAGSLQEIDHCSAPVVRFGLIFTSLVVMVMPLKYSVGSILLSVVPYLHAIIWLQFYIYNVQHTACHIHMVAMGIAHLNVLWLAETDTKYHFLFNGFI